MNPMWLIRMQRWVRRPPSMARVKLVVGVIAICLALYGIEHIFGWPTALTVSPVRP
jgi:hypothetical protein